MNTLKDYVNFRLTHADKIAEAEGYPLKLENCKNYKPMRDLKIYGNSVQDGTPSPENPIEVQSVGELVTDETDSNYGKYKIPVIQRGINLFSMAKCNATAQTINGITFTPLDDERVHIKGTSTGTISYYITTKANGAIPLKAGTYKVKPQADVEILFGVHYFDQSNGISAGNFNSQHSSRVLDKDGYIVSALIYIVSGKTFDNIIELQIMEGTVNLPYEPYVEPITTNIFLDEPLRKLGDYADYIDFKNKKIVRNVREAILKGKDITYRYTFYAVQYNYYLYGTGGNFMPDAYITGFYDWLNSNNPEKSTHFNACEAYSNMITLNCWYINDRYGLHLSLAPETYAGDGVSSTLTDIQTWVQSQYDAGTPLTFYYRLATPTEEAVNLNLPKLIAKTTIIEIDTSLLPSNAYGKYIKR